ncbi:acyl-CoA dehydrogenase [Bordetella pseudohinzii]|uniref:Acyl-CoA dehydrogenase n=1 Tax=Bordetella pseudohinzii TaxID=1331258 RepID=A0A0J6C3U5_9BORD|nr:acyl-CoA dehydrogenase [Bordetella pseudohinzii]ANY16800.1 acyl-CoA dehydrogenase [Bordetella pseudohinzii]KMM25446.1 acyl-CoA dehydrogenase [Bordetella pseudohinzii]KXA76097.1 acyl-CoA dehydrogenase [Bordetella pseudohinzii]KXA78876.1 acyl-CoA dehydrogenase [Bordetella pseudohinzii]CUI91497.1 Acyl-CoA dehydrogenase%2C short-chain specific [Bordetella pseudohinzii]
MNDNDLYADAARDVLADHCTPRAVRDIEAGGPSAGPLWEQLEAAGLADALVSEEAGGSGLGLSQVYGVLEQCGAHALPLPLGETMVARALLPARPAGSIALARGQRLADGAWHCALVRGGRAAAHVLSQAEGEWRLLAAADARCQPHALPLDAAMSWTAEKAGSAIAIAGADSGLDVWTLQAAVAAAQMAGALGWVLERTLQYANERQQFGRPIGKFQAIQHQLAVMSEHVCAARMAAQLGCSGEGALPDRLRVATAKARCSEAALAVAELAHAIHGAIGFTEEYDLQLYTRRLHAWRQTAGSEAYWQEVAGQALLAHEGLTLDLVRRITDVPA